MEIAIKKKKYSYDESLPYYRGAIYDCYIAANEKGKRYFLALPHEGKYEEFLKEKKFLKKIGVDSPKVKKADPSSTAVLMEYHDVSPVEGLLCMGDLPEEVFQEAFRLAKFARLSKYTLSFLPEHFYMGKKMMYYFGTEHFALIDENRFERKDIRLWLPTKEGVDYLKDRGHDVSDLVPLGETEANKAIVLTVAKDYQ